MLSEKLNQSLNDLIHSAENKIIERGLDYHKSGYIESLTLLPDGQFSAEVSGSQGEIYRVFITTENNTVVDFGCDCPFDWGDVCKHIVAVCLAIQAGNYKKNRKSVLKNDFDTRAILASITPDKLKEFLVKYAENNIQFKNELFLTFAKPDTGLVMDEIKERVRSAMSGRTHYGYIEYSDCNYICSAFDKMLEQAEARIEQGHPAIAFTIAMFILLKSVKMASNADSGSRALTETIDYALRIIDMCCEAAEDEGDKKLIYDKCIKESKNKVFDGWDSWAYAVLSSCARLVTEKNVGKMEAALSDLGERQIKRGHAYYQRYETLTRLEITRWLRGETAYDEQIGEYLDIDEVRKIAISRAIDRKDFDLAERLCLERLEKLADRDYYWTHEWYGILYNIYMNSGNTDKQTQLARKLFINQHDFRFYKILKGLFTAQGIWKKEYSSLRQSCADNLPYHMYMEFLKQEKEIRLLYEQIKLHQELVFDYGKIVANEHPKVHEIYCQQIKSQTREASDRKRYKKVCGNLKLLADSGGKELALELITEFRDSFARRPAMLD